MRKSGGALKDGDKAGGIAIGQWLQKGGVHKCEDGNAGARTESEHERGSGGESRILAQLAESETEILQHAFKTEADDVVARFFQAQGAAKLACCGMLCVLWRQSFGLQLFFRVLAMERHFLLQFAIKFFATHEDPELAEEATQRVHESLLCVRLCALQHTTNGRDHLFELRKFHAELFAAGLRQRVVASAAIGFGLLPFGLDPALKQQALQGWVERTFLDGEEVLGRLFNGKGDAVAVLRGAGKRLEDEEVEGAGQKIGFFGHRVQYIDYLWIERQWAGKSSVEPRFLRDAE